mgnify:CR=1 FL=1
MTNKNKTEEKSKVVFVEPFATYCIFVRSFPEGETKGVCDTLIERECKKYAFWSGTLGLTNEKTEKIAKSLLEEVVNQINSFRFTNPEAVIRVNEYVDYEKNCQQIPAYRISIDFRERKNALDQRRGE